MVLRKSAPWLWWRYWRCRWRHVCHTPHSDLRHTWRWCRWRCRCCWGGWRRRGRRPSPRCSSGRDGLALEPCREVSGIGSSSTWPAVPSSTATQALTSGRSAGRSPRRAGVATTSAKDAYELQISRSRDRGKVEAVRTDRLMHGCAWKAFPACLTPCRLC